MSSHTSDATESRVDVLTFLIADVRGYTRFTREHGDAAAAELATRFAEFARDAVEARGGEVIELRGDEAFAVFPSAVQALRAAVELQLTCAEETEADPAYPLLVGIGIDTGPAVAVEDGFRGVAINLAARLCSAAGAGQVLLSDTTARQVRDVETSITLTSRGPSSFKGFDLPIEVVEATTDLHPIPHPAPDSGSRRTPLPPDLAETTPLVGRTHELRWLRGTWRHARRGYGRVVVMSGPTGIGKTRLTAELAGQVDAASGAVRYVGAGGTATASALATIRDAATTTSPMLVVIDDVDAVGPTVLTAIEDSWPALAERPVLVALLSRDLTGRPDLTAVADRANTSGDGLRTLPPLSPPDVHTIVELYAGDAIAAAPVEAIVRASHGVPGLVHELASDWARSEATRRLEAAAEFIAAGRDRRNADLAFANNVIGLTLGRLYAAGDNETLAGSGTNTCPYKGLAAFDETDSSCFFGRERLVGELAARAASSGALAVIGSSGSGKSSVIAAGLLPSLQVGLLPGSERWTHAVMRPGPHPMAALRAALGIDAVNLIDAAADSVPTDGRLLLVVDQFEEVFTTCATETERAEFLSALTDAAGRSERFVVVVSMRSDFYGHLAPYPALTELLADNLVLIAPLTRDELHRAIELPARRTGTRIEAALVDALVDDAADEPGALPLLSTALVELWQMRDGGWIRMTAYEAGGGIRGAVARLAEASYRELDEIERGAARRVLLRLASTGEGDVAIRRRVRLDEFDLDHDAAAAAVIDRFTQDRLLTTTDDSVEVAHEALLREWPRLRRWLEDDVQGRQLHEQLTTAARAWSVDGREPSELYRGPRLSAAVDWSSEHGGDLNDLEREFLSASRQVADHEASSARRTNRRLRALLSGVAALLVLALIAGALAVVQRSHARHAATIALGDSLGAQAVSEHRLDRAMLLARQGLAFDPSDRTRSDLLTALARSPSALRVYHDSANRLNGIAVSPNGRLLALLDNNGNIEVEDASNGTHLAHVTTVDGVVFGPDGSLLVPATKGDRSLGLREIDPRTGQMTGTLRVPSPYAAQVTTEQAPPTPSPPIFPGLSFDPTGTRVALGYTNRNSARPGYVLQLSYPSGRSVGPPLRTPPDAAVPQPTYTANGTRLVLVAGDRTSVYDAATARLIRSYPVGSDTFAVSPDGHTVALASGADGVQFLDLRTGRVVDGNGSDDSAVIVLTFSPDGQKLVSGGEYGAAQVWNVRTHTVTETFNGHSDQIIGQAISPDSSTLYTASFDSTAIAWDLTGRRGLVPTFKAAPSNAELDFWSLADSPNGETIAVGSTDGTVHLWNTKTLRQIAVFHAAPAGIDALSFGPDGRSLLVAAEGLTPAERPNGHTYLRLWQVGAGRPRLQASLQPALGSVNWAALSPDGARVVAAGLTPQQLKAHESAGPNNTLPGAVAEWSAASGRLIVAPTVIPNGTPFFVASALHGDHVVAAGFGGTLEVVDPLQRAVVRQSHISQTIIAAAYSPDGATIAAGDWDGDVDLFNAQTGALERRIPVSPSPITTIAWHGSLLATIDLKYAVRLLDSGTFRQLSDAFTLPHNNTDLIPGTPLSPYAQVSPDGSSLDITDATGRVWIMPVTSSAWEHDACAIANRSFTRSEWAQYAPGRTYQPGCTAG
jgi:WD40 repeat protein/class 3 adenylate cyclase